MEVRSWTSLSNALLFTRAWRRHFTKSGYTAAHVATRRRIAVELSGALVGIGILQAVVYLLFIRAIDLYEREPMRYVVPVFVWGFTVAAGGSLFFPHPLRFIPRTRFEEGGGGREGGVMVLAHHLKK